MTCPVVLVPGMLCDEDLWDAVAPALPSRIVTVRIDEPDISSMAGQILSAVDGPFVLAGLSLGAIAGFEVARLAPQRLAGFAALSSNAGAPRPEQRAMWAEQSERAARGEFAAVTEEILSTMFAHPVPSPALRERFLCMARRIGPTMFRAQLAAQATRTAAYHAIAGLTCPVLVVGGERDMLCPPSFHHDIATHAQNATMQILPGVGHLSPFEAPEAVAALLHHWIQNLPLPRNP